MAYFSNSDEGGTVVPSHHLVTKLIFWLSEEREGEVEFCEEVVVAWVVGGNGQSVYAEPVTTELPVSNPYWALKSTLHDGKTLWWIPEDMSFKSEEELVTYVRDLLLADRDSKEKRCPL